MLDVPPRQAALSATAAGAPRRTFLVQLLCSAVACTAGPGLANASTRPALLVFTSSRDRRSRVIVDAFAKVLGFAIMMTYTLDDEAMARTVRDGLGDFRPSLIFALGDRALAAAATTFRDVPVIFADVSDIAPLGDRTDVLGIGRRPDPDTSVPRIRQALPTVREIATLRGSTDLDRFWEDLERACKGAGVDLDCRIVSEQGDVVAEVEALRSQVDLLWLHLGTALWVGDRLDQVLEAADERDLPVVGFELAQLQGSHPATVVLVGDPKAIALAAAEVARAFLVGGTAPADVVVSMVEPELHGHAARLRDRRLHLGKIRADVFDGWTNH